MGIKKQNKPIYTPPDWSVENDSYFSYFEISKNHQEFIQSKVFKENKNAELLATKLSEQTHSHAVQFFKEVGTAFKTDCEKGCTYCCYQPATAFPFEAIEIARKLKDSLSKKELELLKEKMKARVEDFKGSSVQKQINNKTACPLLVDDKCSVYENRPLTCRMAHSFSVKKCRLSFEKDRTKVQIPVSMELISAISGMIEGVFENLPQKKLDGNLYELSSAVLVALSNPDAAMKWANGDLSVFKDCIKDDT